MVYQAVSVCLQHFCDDAAGETWDRLEFSTLGRSTARSDDAAGPPWLRASADGATWAVPALPVDEESLAIRVYPMVH